MSQPPSYRMLALYAAVGRTMMRYEVDVEACRLHRRENVQLPHNVHYAWPDTAARHLYLALSDEAPKEAAATASLKKHALVVLRIDPQSASLSPHGGLVALPQRPVHITLDRPGEHALIGYPTPSKITVHRIQQDGTVEGEVPQDPSLDFGIFVHQIRVLPSNRTVIAVARGNNATLEQPEDPGALKVFDYHGGMLKNRATIAPGGGLGFGPRHIDFGPAHRHLYAALERQHRLAVFDLAGDDISAEPRFSKNSLVDPDHLAHHQVAGTVRLHPNGSFAYLPNRASGTVDFNGKPVFAGGENSIAVFALNPETGEPTLIQHVGTHGFHARTFAIDPTGRMLIAANITDMWVREGDAVRHVPACLSTYRIQDDGRLKFAGHYDVPTGGQRMFWSGMVAIP